MLSSTTSIVGSGFFTLSMPRLIVCSFRAAILVSCLASNYTPSSAWRNGEEQRGIPLTGAASEAPTSSTQSIPALFFRLASDVRKAIDSQKFGCLDTERCSIGTQNQDPNCKRRICYRLFTVAWNLPQFSQVNSRRRILLPISVHWFGGAQAMRVCVLSRSIKLCGRFSRLAGSEPGRSGCEQRRDVANLVRNACWGACQS